MGSSVREAFGTYAASSNFHHLHDTTAKRTLAGVEAMAMLTKGQVRAVPGHDMPAQRAFVHQIFGLAA